MGILKLKPACKDYLWGGRQLAEAYGVECAGNVLAEAWELSCHRDGPAIIASGEHEGESLREYIEREGKQLLGEHCARFEDFPILIKFIDAKDSLSIQVHPGDAYAQRVEGQYGKIEMWYIMEAERGAFLYYGFRKEISKEEFARRIEDNTLTDILYAVPVSKGDVFFIEPGTVHAIGKGILLAEIQQNSNVTYRIYDYGRVSADGKPRELHVEKALDVADLRPVVKREECYPHVARCEYFTVDKLDLDGRLLRKAGGTVGGESFLSVLILGGEGRIECGGEQVSYRKGDSLFLPASSGDWSIEGSCDALLTTVP